MATRLLGLVKVATVARLVASLTVLAAASPGTVAVGADAFSIAGVRAYLYHQEGGTFGTIDITQADTQLWNVTIGESAAGGKPAGAILVLVDVVGRRFTRAETDGVSVRVRARVEKREAANVQVPLRVAFSQGGRVVIPVLIYGTPCKPMEITAGLEGSRQASQLSRTALFECGE